MLATAQTQRLVYRRDLQTGTNVLISQGDGADGVIPDSTGAFVAADHRRTATRSRSPRAARTCRPRTATATCTPTCSSASSARTRPSSCPARSPTPASAGSQGAGFYTSISADGRYVAFNAEAENLTAEDANSVGDVVVRDRVAGTTTLVSRATGATRRAGRLSLVAPAALGRRLARRVRVARRQPRLDLEPGPGDALASSQRLRPRPGRRHHDARQPRERGQRGARQRRLRRPAGARDLRRRHQGRVPLAGDEPRLRRARSGQHPVVPARPRREHHRRWLAGRRRRARSGR